MALRQRPREWPLQQALNGRESHICRRMWYSDELRVHVRHGTPHPTWHSSTTAAPRETERPVSCLPTPFAGTLFASWLRRIHEVEVRSRVCHSAQVTPLLPRVGGVCLPGRFGDVFRATPTRPGVSGKRRWIALEIEMITCEGICCRSWVTSAGTPTWKGHAKINRATAMQIPFQCVSITSASHPRTNDFECS